MSPRLHLLPVLVAAVVLATTACTDADQGSIGSEPVPVTFGPDTVDLDPDDIVLTSALQTVDSCDDLLARIRAEALDRVGPYGFNTGGPVWFDRGEAVALADNTGGRADADATTAAPAPAAEEAQASPADSATDSTATAGQDTAAGDTSGTNNQEAGVDEADLVKTDGNRLVVLSGNLLRVIDVAGDAPVLVRQIPLPEGTVAGELFLDGDRALIMSSSWTDRPFMSDGRGGAIVSDWYPGSPTGRLIEVDLAGGEVTRTLEFEGGYLSAREVDGTIRVVVSATADRFAFVYPSNESATDSAEAANRALIEDSTIDQWLPTYRVLEDGTEVDAGPMVDCDRLYLPSEFAGFGSLVLLTVDLDDGLEVADATAVLTDAQTVYASPSVVAVATPRWPTWNDDGTLIEPDSAFTTAVHTFDITDPTRATYLASGSVPGHLLNQYSLSEHDGYLRVATTAGSPWGGMGAQSESMITVLGRDGGALVPTGQVAGMGKGEQIYAVRFLGDKGYVVTFRQTDPLYTVDLSDPTNPRLTGELKIPGFSSYLHPVDDDHLLGVGTDGDDQGFIGGTVISLFDVSDPANPTLSAKLPIGIGGPGKGEESSSTPVAYDAKAFTWWQGRAVVPVSWWRYDGRTGAQANGSEAVVVAVGDDGALTELGRVSHPATDYCDGGVIPYPGVPIEGDGGIGDTPDPSGSSPGSGSGTSPGSSGSVGPIVPQTGTGSGRALATTVTATVEPGPDVTIEPPGIIAPGPVPCYTQAPEIIRSLVIGDDLYTVSNAGVAVNTFDGLAPVAWIPFGN